MSGPESRPGPNRAGRVLGALTVLSLIATGYLLWQRNTQKPVAPLEISRNELVLREGQFYRTNESVPFQGFLLEHYADNILKARSAVSNGLLEGLSQGWYTNGQLQVTEYFHAGVSDGSRTKWYETGEKLSEGTIIAGKLHGTFRRWHTNGQVAEQVEMKDGEADGVAVSYYPDGSVKAEARLEKGKLLEQKLWQPGEYQPAPKPGK